MTEKEKQDKLNKLAAFHAKEKSSSVDKVEVTEPTKKSDFGGDSFEEYIQSWMKEYSGKKNQGGFTNVQLPTFVSNNLKVLKEVYNLSGSSQVIYMLFEYFLQKEGKEKIQRKANKILKIN